jgi:CRISPR-associated protein Cas4
MENYIKLSTLRDFEFCPKSIYYHTLYENFNDDVYKWEAQKAGTLAHKTIDNKHYSTRKEILQWLDVYSEEYWICGKIDIFNKKTGELVERKNFIQRENNKEKIYLWYKYQLWWQMFCLEEMWYIVNSLWLYSIKDNRKYRIYKPSDLELIKFQNFLEKYKKFDPSAKWWTQNTQKCIKCIYKELCDYYIWEVYPQLVLFENVNE